MIKKRVEGKKDDNPKFKELRPKWALRPLNPEKKKRQKGRNYIDYVRESFVSFVDNIFN